MPKSPIRLFLLDPEPVALWGLEAMLAGEAGFRIVGTAGAAAGGLAAIRQADPSLVVLEAEFPDMPGSEICRLLKAENPQQRVLFLTRRPTDSAVFEAVNSGADGFILKTSERDHIVRSLVSVAGGESVLAPEVTQALFRRIRKGEAASEPQAFSRLSRQEYRVLEQVSRGLTNKQIGEVLGLSDKTIKNYLRNAMEKVGAARRAEAAVLFIRHRDRKPEGVK